MAHIVLNDIALVQQALADPVRLLIVRLLVERELCVCEIQSALRAPQYKVSRHLAVLRNAGVVQARKQGLWMHYELSRDLPKEWRATLEALMRVLDASPETRSVLDRARADTTRAPGSEACCRPRCCP
jgi:ArsR family transcriptional regulator